MRVCLLLAALCAARAGSVEGTVTDSVTGGAVRKATVTLYSPKLRARYISGVDDRGQFAFPDVEAGTDYRIEVYARGYAMPAPTREVLKETHPIAVSKEEAVKAITVKVVPLGAISGRVVDADGDPVRGVTVQAMQYQYRASGRRLDSRQSVVTDPNGNYRLYFLQPGRYLVRAYIHQTPPGPAEPTPHVHNFIPEEGYAAAYYPGAPDASGGAVVELKPAADVTGYDFRLARTAAYHVRGRVDGAQGKPSVALAPCATRAMDFGFTVAADSKADGTFDARGITPGQYCLAVPHAGGRLVMADAQLQVKDKDVNGVELAAPVTVAVRGAVQMDPSDAERPKNLRVDLADRDTPGLLIGIGKVQDDGTFSMVTVPAGPASLTVAGRPENVYLKSYRFGERAATGQFEIPRSGGTLALVLGTDGGQLRGKVTDEDGNPGDHMVVTLAPKGDLANRTDLIQTAPTRDDGSFQMKGVAPGDYSLYAWESVDDQAARAPDFLKLFSGKAATVAVSGSGSAQVQLKPVKAQEMEEATWKPEQ